tara:strand:- start:3840 stop:4145 length:306 start_codon:yes stop_codon:yes gene_type:complete
MAKSKKKSNRDKIASIVRKASGGFAKTSIYREFGDYNPSQTDQRSAIGRHSRSGSTPAQWASRLIISGGKSAGDVFKMGGKMYKITSGGRPGSISAEEVKV